MRRVQTPEGEKRDLAMRLRRRVEVEVVELLEDLWTGMAWRRARRMVVDPAAVRSWDQW